jgi:hypothetical protein
MAAPLLVPLILVGGTLVALAAASAKKKRVEPDPGGGGGRTYTLDPNMPPQMRDQVLAALTMEQDPARLEWFASAIWMSYPLAAAALRTKAAMLRPLPAPSPAVPVPLPIPPVPAPSVEPPPRPVPPPPPPVVPRPPPPIAPPPVVPPPIEPAPPSPVPVGPPMPIPIPPLPAPLLGGLDPGMPLEMQRAVLGALTTESDPAKLQGFASAIQGEYPVAAGLLMAKAQALLLARPIIPPAPIPGRPQPGPQPLPVPPSPVPVVTNGTYAVQSGDFPIKIAQKLVHDGARWHELVAANPNKKRAADGNFATLLPGEVLKLPASWTPTPSGDAKTLALLPPGGSHAPHS